MDNSQRTLHILLVEDDKADILFTKRIIRKSKLRLSVTVATDGAEALRYLQKFPPYTDAPNPDLVLLDLNLPKVNGHAVLQKIRSHPDLKHLPVVILTTSQANEDVAKSYKEQANCYITKPVDIDEYTRVVKAIENFWLNVVSLPTEMH